MEQGEVMPTTTGQRLKEAREYLGFAFEEVCNFAQISATWMAEIELGQVEPNPAQLARLAQLYQRPVAWFTDEILYMGQGAKANNLTIPTGDLDPADAIEVIKFAEFLRCRKAARHQVGPSQPEQSSQ
jgi:transcriptional regulator with XRE-family HTH domain